jgi:hypothetical protein
MNRARLVAFVVGRLREASTWRGIVLMLTAFGAGIEPRHAEAIVAAGVGLAGLLAVLLPDQVTRTPESP